MAGQEYKLQAHNLKCLQFIWPSATFVAAPALDGIHVERNDNVLAGGEGVFLAFGSKWHQYFTTTGILQSDKACWAHFEHPQLGRFSVLAVYAPNKDSKRAELWHEIVDGMDPHQKWFFVGDFNNVEESVDRRGGSGRVLWAERSEHGHGWSTNYVSKIPTDMHLECSNTTGIAKNVTATTRTLNLLLTLENGCWKDWRKYTTLPNKGTTPSPWPPQFYQGFASLIMHL